jgi:hypothetical protein
MSFPFQYILNSLQSNYSIIAQFIHENSIRTFSNHNTSFNICDRQHTVLIQYFAGPKFFTHNLLSSLFTFCQFRLLVVSLVAIIPPVQRLYQVQYFVIPPLPGPPTQCVLY